MPAQGATNAAGAADDGDLLAFNIQRERNYASSLEDNRAEDGDGGGVRNAGGSVTLTGGSVEDNFASRDGGGLYTSSGTVEITGVSFQNNDPDNCSGAVIGTCV